MITYLLYSLGKTWSPGKDGCVCADIWDQSGEGEMLLGQSECWSLPQRAAGVLSKGKEHLLTI